MNFKFNLMNLINSQTQNINFKKIFPTNLISNTSDISRSDPIPSLSENDDINAEILSKLMSNFPVNYTIPKNKESSFSNTKISETNVIKENKKSESDSKENKQLFKKFKEPSKIMNIKNNSVLRDNYESDLNNGMNKNINSNKSDNDEIQSEKKNIVTNFDKSVVDAEMEIDMPFQPKSIFPTTVIKKSKINKKLKIIDLKDELNLSKIQRKQKRKKDDELEQIDSELNDSDRMEEEFDENLLDIGFIEKSPKKVKKS